MKSRIVLRLLGIATLLVVTAAPTYYHRTRPRDCCGIPIRDYQLHSFSPTTTSPSNVPLLLRPVDPTGSRQVKAFQFVEQARVTIDHCAVSNISVLLQQDGRWTLSFVGHHNNPQDTDVANSNLTAEPADKQSSFVKRNAFHVSLRCYVRHSASANSDLGQAVVFPLQVKPVWVQSGLPRDYFATGADPRVGEFFAEIDRIEFDFRYRKS